MNVKKLLLILVSAVLLTACVKPEDPIEPTVTKFSVLGDSYSALEGYLDPDTNDPWPYYAEIGITDVEQMWWSRVASAMEWAVDRNNSFSGSLICNYGEFDGGEHYLENSFIHSMDGLGHPDVIFILGGANDVWHDVPFGDYVYADWTEEQLCSFRPALAFLLDHVKQQYPNAKLYFLLEPDPFSGTISEEVLLNYIESVHHITNHYGVDCLDLEIHKDWYHPDVRGQKDIARQVLERLEMDFNV